MRPGGLAHDVFHVSTLTLSFLFNAEQLTFSQNLGWNGALPTELGDLTDLGRFKAWSVASCLLAWRICSHPPFLSLISRRTEILNFAGSLFQGTIPTELGLCTSLGKYALLYHAYPYSHCSLFSPWCLRYLLYYDVFQELLITHETNLQGDIPTQLGALLALRK